VKTLPVQTEAQPIGDAALPDSATQIIHALACKMVLCSRVPPGEHGVTATIRSRPVDEHGRAGCHVEFRTAGPPPLDGLQAVYAAGGDLAGPCTTAGLGRPERRQPVVAMHALGLDELLLGGWRMTVDLRWSTRAND
jgi:hypothetical protein